VNRYRWTTAEVRRALDLPQEHGDGDAPFEVVSTDTRALQPNSLFVALAGERFDAHDFLHQAREAGATGAVVSRVPDDAPDGLRLFVVENTLAALGRLARHRRRALDARVVGVVGSNGKTTTKDLLRAVLGARYRVHATEGNFNNQIGLPLTLLAAPNDAEVLVLEMGTNEPGEVAILSAIAEPDAAVVTAIAEEHLEKLGDLEGVLREEISVLDSLPDHGFGVVAEDPPALPERATGMLGAERVRVAGFGEDADLSPDGGRSGVTLLPDGTTRWSWDGVEIHLPLRGVHNVRNALVALGVAREWGVSPPEAGLALERMPAPKLRGEWHQIGGVRVIADCYNSNPYGLEAAADLLASLPAEGEKILVVGTMRELGEQEAMLHRRSAETLAARVGEGVDRVIATGRFVPAFTELAEGLGEGLVVEEDPLAAFERVGPTLRGDETILLKASRGEALERWLPLLERKFNDE
jgi:UDP-N-acetylmuramoyl-tripeptide--D-alanyl-D-alanine ligase